MPRDALLERSILDILDRLSPTPLQERTLLREAEIATDRLIVTTDFQDSLKQLQDRKLIDRGQSALGYDQCWITDTGKAALRS